MSKKEISRKVTFKTVLLQLAFIVCLILTGVSLPVPAQNEAGEEKLIQKENWEQTVKDAWIQGKLEGIYLFNESLSSSAIDTLVNNGDVQLTGAVSSEIDKELAGEIAKGIEGVRQVDNQLMVEEGDSGRVAASRDRSTDRNEVRTREVESRSRLVRWVNDATISAIVKSKLLANEGLSGMGIDVDTHNNRVTLSGEVESEEVRQLVVEIAENTEDVTDVENNLHVSDRVAVAE